MDIKPRPNDEKYREILRAMTPEQKLEKVFELNELGKELFIAGYMDRNPQCTLVEAIEKYRLYNIKCPNNNY